MDFPVCLRHQDWRVEGLEGWGEELKEKGHVKMMSMDICNWPRRMKCCPAPTLQPAGMGAKAGGGVINFLGISISMLIL